MEARLKRRLCNTLSPAWQACHNTVLHGTVTRHNSLAAAVQLDEAVLCHKALLQRGSCAVLCCAVLCCAVLCCAVLQVC